MESGASSFEFPSWIVDYVDCINQEISTINANAKTGLDRAAIDAISKGKRVRAILALLWCELLSGDYKPAAAVAVAYEIAHAAALVQDDVIDRSDSRRGERSIVGKYGVSGAILTSNMLLFHVPNMIAKYGRQGADSETLCRLLDLLGECYRSATLGEFLDLEMADKETVSEEEYSEMIRLKTGALIGASSASGALIGGAVEDHKIVSNAYTFGECLGVAYQVQDDLLDLLGEEEAIGKPIFADMRSGKKSLALIHLMDHCSEQEVKFVKSLLRKSEPYHQSEINKLRELLIKHGSAAYAQRFASGYIERAEKALSSMKDSEAKDRLLELSHFLATRKY